jgi:hypothetical protein
LQGIAGKKNTILQTTALLLVLKPTMQLVFKKQLIWRQQMAGE